MDPLVATLNHIFDVQFPGSRHPIGPVLPNSSRIGGYVVWDNFEDQSQRERQATVWNAIRQNLPISDQQRITAILTLTGTEEQGILESE